MTNKDYDERFNISEQQLLEVLRNNLKTLYSYQDCLDREIASMTNRLEELENEVTITELIG